MVNLKLLEASCRAELNMLGIYPKPISTLKWNNSNCSWGLCTSNIYSCDIELSKNLQESPDAARETMLHELLHAVDGCHGHKGKWKTLAELVNNELGTHIKRTNTAEEKGIEKDPRLTNAKYGVWCPTCKKYICYRTRKNVYMDPSYLSRCQCGTCRGKNLELHEL